MCLYVCLHDHGVVVCVWWHILICNTVQCVCVCLHDHDTVVYVWWHILICNTVHCVCMCAYTIMTQLFVLSMFEVYCAHMYRGQVQVTSASLFC